MTRTKILNRMAALIASAAMAAVAATSQAAMICPSSGNAFNPDNENNNQADPIPGTWVSADCFTTPPGGGYEEGTTRARGQVLAGEDSVTLQAYLFGNSSSLQKEARIWGVVGTTLRAGCYARDQSADGKWGTAKTITDDSVCVFAQHFRVVAYNNLQPL